MQKVLIVDDSEIIRKGVETLLKPLDVEFFHAVNGIDGVRKALRHHPDVITMDVEMPHLNGFYTARILNMLELKIPIIFISSKTEIEESPNRFPTIVNYCSKTKLQTDLLGMVSDALKIEPWEYKDLTYTLKQREALDLLSLSERKKILVLEDSRMMMSVILEHLDQTGLFELFHAPDGKEGIFKATMIQPDLILTDIEMPGMDGITMAQTLYIMGHPFPIAFVTSKSDVQTVERAMKLDGVRGFLIKHEILKDGMLFQKRVIELMDVSPEQKEALEQNYQKIDMEKLKSSGEKSGGVFKTQYNPEKKRQLSQIRR
ncbi:MAG: response regulator [SAR324 cluster bacterium]|nr:response regulator [SAR324 cluster bacterium]